MSDKPTREEVKRCKQGVYDHAAGIITDVKIKEIWDLIDALLDENQRLKEEANGATAGFNIFKNLWLEAEKEVKRQAAVVEEARAICREWSQVYGENARVRYELLSRLRDGIKALGPQ
jgi:hypothetical protein